MCLFRCSTVCEGPGNESSSMLHSGTDSLRFSFLCSHSETLGRRDGGGRVPVTCGLQRVSKKDPERRPAAPVTVSAALHVEQGDSGNLYGY